MMIKNKINKEVLVSNVASIFFITAFVSFSLGSYPFLKAQLAQHLLTRAWQIQPNHHDSQKQNVNKPWPWADFYPVAKLNFERLKKSQIVLNNDSGQALAFGPGVNQTTLRGGEIVQSDIVMISAHNDTHFRVLEELRIDDKITLTLKSGDLQKFIVRRFVVLDVKSDEIFLSRNDRGVSKNHGINELFLVTCYPFSGINSRTTLRYVVLLESLTT